MTRLISLFFNWYDFSFKFNSSTSLIISKWKLEISLPPHFLVNTVYQTVKLRLESERVFDINNIENCSHRSFAHVFQTRAWYYQRCTVSTVWNENETDMSKRVKSGSSSFQFKTNIGWARELCFYFVFRLVWNGIEHGYADVWIFWSESKRWVEPAKVDLNSLALRSKKCVAIILHL